MKIAMPLMLAWYFHKYEADAEAAHYGVAACCSWSVRARRQAARPGHGAAHRRRRFLRHFFAGLPWKIIIGLLASAAAAAPSCGTCCTTTSRSAS